MPRITNTSILARALHGSPKGKKPVIEGSVHVHTGHSCPPVSQTMLRVGHQTSAEARENDISFENKP